MGLPRYAKPRDKNAKAIITALESAGCQVWELHQPLDLLVWSPRQQQNHLVEIKNPDGFNRFTKAQKRFRETWWGPWYVIRTVDEALELVGVRRRYEPEDAA